jgi:hypothetical protein
MRFKTSLILLGICAAAALFFFVVERPRHEREAERAAREGRITDVSPGDVYRVTITRPDITIAVEREEDHWKLVSPVVDRADDAAVNTLLETACGARAEEEFNAGGAPLSEFGLVAPSAAVRLTAQNGEELFDLRVGEFSLTKSHCYATTRGGDKVFLLPAGVRRYALRPLFDYRYKRIFDVPVADVFRLEIAAKTQSMVWNTDKTGTWFTVQSGDTIRGDSTSVESVIRTLRGLRAKNIPFGVPGYTGAYFGKRVGAISVRFKPDSTEITLAFSDPHGQGCYVESSESNRVALVDTTMLDVFAKTITDLRDRRLLRHGLDAVVRMTLETPRRTTTLVRSGAKWSFANPEFGDADEEAVRRLVARIDGVKFDAVLDEDMPEKNGHGFEKPALRLTLYGPQDRAIDELTIGDPASDGLSRYVWSRSAGVLALIKSAYVSRLEEDFGDPGAP